MFATLRAFARHRPWLTTLLAVVLVALVGVAGVHGYGLREFARARAALKDGRAADARPGLEFCVRLWPWSVPTRVLAARAARVSGDLAAAEAHLTRCLKMQRGATEAIQLENILMRVQTGEVDDVSVGLQELVDRGHPESAMILETLAGAYMNNLRYRPALVCLNRWIEEDPTCAQAYQYRGWVYDRMALTKDAMAEFAKAVELDPNLVQVRLRMAIVYLEKAEVENALEHLLALPAEAQKRPDVMARLGQARLMQGNLDEARELMEMAVEGLPDDPILLVQLAKLDLRERKYEQAERRLRRVLKNDPADVEARYTLGAVLQRQPGREKEAEAELKEEKRYRTLLEQANHLLKLEVEQPSQDPNRPAEAGALLVSIGQDRLGLFWLHQALKRDPEHQGAHRALAEYYEAKGEKEKARAHRQRLVEPKGGPGKP